MYEGGCIIRYFPPTPSRQLEGNCTNDGGYPGPDKKYCYSCPHCWSGTIQLGAARESFEVGPATARGPWYFLCLGPSPFLFKWRVV